MKTDLLAIATARSPFRVILAGNALAPRYYDGQQLIVTPGRPAAPGDVVLALCPTGKKTTAGGVRGEVVVPSFMELNRDNSLTAGPYNVAAGEYRLLGVVTGTAA